MTSLIPDANGSKSRISFEERLIAKALKDDFFKEELIRNPRAVIAKEFGTQLPTGIEIIILEETKKILYVVLPYRT